jgi:hypothetical protein
MTTWTDAVSQLAESLDLFNRFVVAIKNAYNVGIDIARDQLVRPRLESLKMEMIRVNADKGTTNQYIRDYLNGSSTPDWRTIQDDSKTAASHIEKIREAVENTDIGATMNEHSALIDSLKNQEKAYKSLANFPPPVSDGDKAKAKEFADKLEALLIEVKELERILDEQTRRGISSGQK